MLIVSDDDRSGLGASVSWWAAERSIVLNQAESRRIDLRCSRKQTLIASERSRDRKAHICAHTTSIRLRQKGGKRATQKKIVPQQQQKPHEYPV